MKLLTLYRQYRCKHLSKVFDLPAPRVKDSGKLFPVHCQKCGKNLGLIKV